MMKHNAKQAALDYHAKPLPGKVSVEITKPADTQADLALAYSPGVAEPVKAIARNPEDAYLYTAKGNLVAVISNGTAILGLGNLGALASKPVMEGKSLLFKRFAGINSVDIEVDETDPDELIKTIHRIAPSFGGINLEDIAAPACFKVEERLIELCDIPVFHDDQHGTAIVTLAGLKNAMEIQNKKLEDAKIVIIGAGSAAIRCADLMREGGASKHHIIMVDSRGVIRTARTDLSTYKQAYARDTDIKTLKEACVGADALIGLSGPDLISPEMLKSMNKRPIVFACSNPDPEIDPQLARETCPDIIMATGRSDYANQVNNVLGFPFIFRGALDTAATTINTEMKIAAAQALSDLAKEPVPEEVVRACGLKELKYGPDYIIPKPIDPRLLTLVSAAVAKAAVESGVARNQYPAHYPLKSTKDIKY